jgi:uncharacterized membrane protein YdjX (TVP38/TMEM64 family)
VERRLAGDSRLVAVDRAIGREGLRILVLLRLSPAIPFSLLNYLLGLTRVSLRDFVVACGAMLPGTIMYAYYGSISQDLASLMAGSWAPPRSPLYYALTAVGLAATIVVTTLTARIATRALREATGNS